MDLRSKIGKALYQIYKKREIEKHILQYVFLEITKKCNLNCLHCGSDCSKDLKSPELTTDSWFKIIDYLANVYSKNIAFVLTGGEPLLHPDIYNIGGHISSKGMRWGMVTNGVLLHKNNIEKLINSGIFSITVSLDGLKNSHNWLRNNSNAFDKTLEALQLTGFSNIKYRDVVTCVTNRNLKELNDIANLLIENRITDWRLFRIFPSGRAGLNHDLKLSFEETKYLLDWIKTNRPGYKKKNLNINLSCEGWVPFNEDKKLRDFPFFCRSGINIASILSDGTITGCSNNSKGFHVGNILTDNFKQTWEHKFDNFRKKEWLNRTVCSNCMHIRECRGGSIHLWEMGDVKPKFCYVNDMEKEDTHFEN